MSLPKDLLEQLLSGYLDDALSADERVRVEQLLRTSAEAADELQQLRDLRRSLQVLSRVDSNIKLERGFADRVLGAAVARAREEGLGDDHPLIRLAEQPSTSPSVSATSSSSWRVPALLVGLAASIVIAVLVLRPKVETGPNLIAKSDTAAIELQDGRVVPEVVEQNLGVEPNSRVEPGPMLVESGQPAADTSQSVVPDSIASVDTATMTPATDASVVKLPGPMTQLGAILVVDVRRTAEGRASDAFGKAMSAAEIAPASRKEVTEQVAGFVAGNVEDDSEDASVLYLQVTGKQFDLLYQQLWADEAGIESVRMTVAMNAPFLQVVDSVRPDPTTVRHEAAAYELFSQSGVVDQLAHELSQLPFPDVDRRSAATSMLGSGPDIQAEVLMLVR